ncbi:MAG TPA: hypothetical protein VKV25_08665, partial [Acidimicrobiales bacterium]|nr:hypothetical protein [Acidimicrobiales bacterium]
LPGHNERVAGHAGEDAEREAGRPDDAGIDLDLPPLTARSVLLSILLGSRPPQLPVRVLVRTGELFGISEGAVRVALSRMAAEGEVDAHGGSYALNDRFVHRRAALEAARRPPLRPWSGRWEVAVLADDLDNGTRAELSEGLAGLHLARWRDGVWTRPDNLRRPWPAALAVRCERLVAVPDTDPVALAAELWDLDGWAARAGAILRRLRSERAEPIRFALGAAAVRHLRAEPLLPPALLPPGWPATALRRAYGAYERDLARLLGSAGG